MALDRRGGDEEVRPSRGEGDVPDLLGGVTRGVEGADHGTHAGAHHEIGIEPMSFESKERTGVCQAPRGPRGEDDGIRPPGRIRLVRLPLQGGDHRQEEG